jgi:copper(I)-binding protein
MTRIYRLGGLLAALLLGANVYAAEVSVEGAWSRATAPGQDAAMVDLSITSVQAATLVGVSSPACKAAELHSMTHEGGVMKMREVKEIALTAGQRVGLGESGYHLMLIGLKAPLKAGEVVPLTLNVRLADKRVVNVEVKAEVRPLTEARAMQQGGGHMHHEHH